MAGLNVWVAQVPIAEGAVGTGPVDLAMATQALRGPEGFDLPGGSGEIFQRAATWFLDASNVATTQHEYTNHLLDAVRALNNLAVWCMTRWQHPEAAEAALDALKDAEKFVEEANRGGELQGGVYFNLGNLMLATNQPTEATRYFNLAHSFGVGESPEARAARSQSSRPASGNSLLRKLSAWVGLGR